MLEREMAESALRHRWDIQSLSTINIFNFQKKELTGEYL